MFNKIKKKLSLIAHKDNDQILRDIAFTSNLAKNGMTIKTDDHEALTRIFTGQKMYVDTRDVSVAPHIMLDGEWETNLVKYIRSRVKEDSIIFDIGANFGFYGLVLSTNNPFGKTYFFEANSDLIKYINKSISVNGLGNKTKVINAAVGDMSEGYSIINIHEELWGSATVHSLPKDTKHKSLKIQNMTIDDFCEKEGIDRVDLIKMDIEGFEDKAFAGMKKTLRKNPQLEMFLEYTHSSYVNPKGFYEEIRRYFDIFKILDESTGQLIDVDSYTELYEYSQGWVMLYLANE